VSGQTETTVEGRVGAATARDAVADPLVPASRIGRYAVTGTLGHGGMGVVVAARDDELGRPLAIKLLHPDARGDTAVATARLEREAQAMAKLSHPNVVTVYEVGRWEGRPFIAMELVDGETLRDWRMEKERPWRDALRVAIGAGRGLAAAHAVGLVHRDFKPENILIGSDGRPRVSDFGLVSASTTPDDDMPATGDSNMTRGSFLGTPAYMSPEQWRGDAIDARTDQFAFAVVCWELLWGKRPFVGETRGELKRFVIAGTITPLLARRGVPARIEAALRRALHPEREQRWPDLSALLDELERRARDRRPLVAAVAAGVLAIGVIVGLGMTRNAAGATCATAGDDLDAVWSPARRDALGAGFPPEVWKDVAQSLDGWAAELRTMRVEDCELARTRSEGVGALAAAREVCLDRRVADLGALLDALADPDVTVVQYARAAARSLPRPAGCRAVQLDPAAASLPAAPDAGDVDQVHAALARSAAQRALGKPRDAVVIAEDSAARADRLGWSPLIAEAQLELALAYQATQDNDKGQRAHQQAYWHADASHDDATRFRATLGLSTAAIDHSEFDEAGRLIESARMIARRLPADAERDVAIATQAATLASWRGDNADCVTLTADAIAAIDRAGTDQIEGARMRLVRANCQQELGHASEAGDTLRDALSIAEATTGREHPLAAQILSNLGSVAREQERPADALAYYQESLAIRERIFGAENPEVAKALNNIGNALRELKRYDEARASLERAIVIWEKNWGSDSPAISTSSNALGEVAMDQGDWQTAERHFQRALAIRRKKRPPGHIDILATLVKIGRARLAAHDREAVTYFEEAVAGYAAAADQLDPAENANARFLLGRAYVELAKDRKRGLPLIEGACADLQAGESWKAEAQACRDYLNSGSGAAR
jgi:tetratricopeptide (TPR) repeat protein